MLITSVVGTPCQFHHCAIICVWEIDTDTSIVSKPSIVDRETLLLRELILFTKRIIISDPFTFQVPLLFTHKPLYSPQKMYISRNFNFTPIAYCIQTYFFLNRPYLYIVTSIVSKRLIVQTDIIAQRTFIVHRAFICLRALHFLSALICIQSPKQSPQRMYLFRSFNFTLIVY